MEMPPAPTTARSVVGSFIFKNFSHGPSGPPRVALFRRSGKVRTYQHKFAPISGSIEPTDPNPLTAALRELREETTLTPSSLHLRARGKPYSFTDTQLNRLWTIHPFAFELLPPSQGGKGEEGIVTDWEHEGWDWFDPTRVTDEDAFGGVPRLAMSLRRAWPEYDLGPEAGGILTRGLVMLQEDHESGARVLAGKALDVLSDVLVALEAGGKELWWENARMSAWHLWRNGRESMGAAILSVMLSCLRAVEKDVLPRWDDLDQNSRGAAIRESLQTVASARSALNDETSKSFQSFLQTTYPDKTHLRVLTLSASSTITSCLLSTLNTSDTTLDIRVLESRPLFEGVYTAAALSKIIQEKNKSRIEKHSVTLFTDAAAAVAAQGVDLVLLGADLISADGAVCNKTGSLPAVLSARHVSPGAKVLAVADTEKVYPFEKPPSEENNVGEVTAAWNGASAPEVVGGGPGADVEVKNVYFEWVGPELIDGFVFGDAGIKSPDEVAAIAGRVEAEADHFFKDL